MSNNYYKGVTAYVTNLFAGDFVTLSTIMPNMKSHFVPASHDNDTVSTIDNEMWNVIKKNNHLFNPTLDTLPKNMPDNYTAPHIQKVNIKNCDLYKIHIPIVSQSESEVEVMAHIIYDLLEDIFGERLFSIKAGSARPENYDESEGRIEVILSTEKYNEQYKKDVQPIPVA